MLLFGCFQYIVDIIFTSDLFKAEAIFAVLHTHHSFSVFPTSICCLHIYCDGSYYPARRTRATDMPTPPKAGWAFTVLAQMTASPEGPYSILLSGAGPLLPETLEECNVTDMGSDVSEAYAIHQAVKFALTTPFSAVVHYDNQSVGQSASGEAQHSSRTLPLKRATRGLGHLAEARGQPITFFSCQIT